MEINTVNTPLQNINFDGNECRIYGYFGKRSKKKCRLMTAAYCLKFGDVLSSSKRISIISGGGVLRNKKLQKGSKLALSWSDHDKNLNPSIINNYTDR